MAVNYKYEWLPIHLTQPPNLSPRGLACVNAFRGKLTFLSCHLTDRGLLCAEYREARTGGLCATRLVHFLKGARTEKDLLASHMHWKHPQAAPLVVLRDGWSALRITG